jgi:CubicO group peptidase (beta-lactamase class C family)
MPFISCRYGYRIVMLPTHVLLYAALMLLSPCAMAGLSEEEQGAGGLTPGVQARVANVERGLSTPVRVRGAPIQRWTLAERMAFHQVPAVSVAVIDKGRIEWTRAYGVLDTATRRPATTTSLFQAASVSKSVSALGAMRLVELGSLSLDAPANTQLSGWEIPDNRFTDGHPVTLRALLNHSAGMTVHGFYGYAADEPVPTLLQILDGIPPANSDPIRVESTPGTAWVYSGGGYTVVQQMMSDVGAQSFPQLMRALVLDPLGMRDSSFETLLPADWEARAAHGYDGEGREVPGGWKVHPESAAAGLWTTPTDLAQMVVDIQKASDGRTGTLLSRATTASMLSRGLGEYGLGFYVEPMGQGTSFSHSGGTTGFRSRFYGYTHTGQGIVVLTNSDNGAALIDEIIGSVSAEYGWPEFQQIEKAAIPADPALNRAAAGSYELAGKPAKLIADGHRLFFQSALFGRERMELFAQSPLRYFMTAQDMVLDVQRTPDGDVTGFTLIRGASRYPATRNEDAATRPH